MQGDALANAIAADHLELGIPSVLALLPLPSVLDMMSRDMAWTRHLGDAALMQRPEVMNAVQENEAKGLGLWVSAAEHVLKSTHTPVTSEILPWIPPTSMCLHMILWLFLFGPSDTWS